MSAGTGAFPFKSTYLWNRFPRQGANTLYESIGNPGTDESTAINTWLFGTSNPTITGSTGSYTLTGTAATLTWSGGTTYQLSGNPGSYALTGSNAQFPYLSGTTGTYALSGISSSLTYSGAPKTAVTRYGMFGLGLGGPVIGPFDVTSSGGGSDPWALPTPTFSTTNLLVWADQTTNSKYYFIDSYGTPSISCLEDMTGNGNGFVQTVKSLQPTVGPNSGAFFANSGQLLELIATKNNRAAGLSSGTQFTALSPLVGLTQITVGMTFTLSSTYSGAALRTLFNYSGDKYNIQFTGGTTSSARKCQITIRPDTTSTDKRITPVGTQLSVDTKHQLIVQTDFTVSPTTTNIYIDGSLYIADTWTPPTNPQPWHFTSPDAGSPAISIGTDTGGQTTPLVGEIFKLVVYGSSDPAIRTNLQTYLAA